jgi:hypothetical protein
MPGQKAHVPRIYEYPYTAYLAFRVVSFMLNIIRRGNAELMIVPYGMCGILTADLDGN